MGGWFTESIAEFFNFLVGATMEVAMYFIDFLPDINFPFSGNDVIEFVFMVKQWNAFFPITEMMAMMGIYVAYILIFSSIKIVIKLIPMIG